MNEANHDIRWKQRLSHYKKSFELLRQSVAIMDPSEVERAGLILFFKMSYELAWKLLKDYMEEEGLLELASPRGTLKQAFQIGLIQDGHIWLEALQDRNLTVHTYEEKIALEVEKKIRDLYFPVLETLLQDFIRRAEL